MKDIARKRNRKGRTKQATVGFMFGKNCIVINNTASYPLFMGY